MRKKPPQAPGLPESCMGTRAGQSEAAECRGRGVDRVSGLLTGFPVPTKILVHNSELTVTRVKQPLTSSPASLGVFSAQRQLSKTMKINVN